MIELIDKLRYAHTLNILSLVDADGVLSNNIHPFQSSLDYILMNAYELKHL